MPLDKDVLAALILARNAEAFPGKPFSSTDTSWSPIASAIIDHFKAAAKTLLNIQKLTADTTYVATTGAVAVRIRMVGGGGGGGPGITTAGAAGGGAGTGEWAEMWYAPGTQLVGGAAVVGLGGAATIGGGLAGGNTSVVIDGNTFAVVGGTGGFTTSTVTTYGEASPVALGTVGTTVYDLFRGSNPSVTAMISATTAGITAFTAGLGGSTPFGRGGRGSGGDAVGEAGTGFGAGGGGGRRGAGTSRAGGVGAPGLILLEEYGL